MELIVMNWLRVTLKVHN